MEKQSLDQLRGGSFLPHSYFYREVEVNILQKNRKSKKSAEQRKFNEGGVEEGGAGGFKGIQMD